MSIVIKLIIKIILHKGFIVKKMFYSLTLVVLGIGSIGTIGAVNGPKKKAKKRPGIAAFIREKYGKKDDKVKKPVKENNNDNNNNNNNK